MELSADPIRVLHVDADPDFLESAATHLDRADDRIDVETATSATDAHRRLEESPIDCVVAGDDLPDRTGLDFLAEVRETRPDLPVILMTGIGSEAVTSAAISAGVTDSVQQDGDASPFELVADRIRHTVDRRRTTPHDERTEEHLRVLAEHADDILWMYTADWEELVFINSAYEDIWGRPIDELREFPPSFQRGVHPDDRSITREAMETLSAGESIDIEFRVNAEEDFGRWVWVKGDPIVDAAGTVTHVAGFARDVTDRKEHELELERVRSFFTEAERLGDLGAWEFDGDGHVVWTEGTRRIHGVDAGYEPTIEDGLAFFDPDDRDRIRAAVEAALEDGEGYDVEARIETVDGDQRWVRARGTPLDDGTVRGFIQDVTDRKKREEALVEANAQLEAAVEAGAVGTWQWKIPEDDLVVGPAFARRFGVDPAEARSGVPLERFTSSIHPEDRDRVEAKIAAAVEDCAAYHAEYRVRNADDELRWVVARGDVHCDEAGEPLTFPGALVDITDRKRAERALEDQNDRLDEFASLVSHDLRNPLSVAEGRLELAREEQDSDHLEAVARAHERMQALIDDLLAMARETEQRATLEPVALDRLVERCWATVATADATVESEVDGVIRADSRRLQQLFENLFRNAVEHGGDGVTVTVGPLDDGFYVADDGPGIPADVREAVFESGYSTRRGGTGYGLNIVQQVADAHGWAIGVTEGADGGARFEFTGVEYSN